MLRENSVELWFGKTKTAVDLDLQPFFQTDDLLRQFSKDRNYWVVVQTEVWNLKRNRVRGIWNIFLMAAHDSIRGLKPELCIVRQWKFHIMMLQRWMTAVWNAVIYFPNMQFIALIMTKEYDKAPVWDKSHISWGFFQLLLALGVKWMKYLRYRLLSTSKWYFETVYRVISGLVIAIPCQRK